MQKIPTHVLPTSGKHTTRCLEKSFRQSCGITILSVACWWASRHCLPAQKLVSVKSVTSQPPLVCIGHRHGCVFIVDLNWIDSNSRVDERITVGSCTVCFLRTLWYCLHPLSRFFKMHSVGFLLRVTEPEWKLAVKNEVVCLSRNPRQRTLQASGFALQQEERFKYLGVVFTSDQWRKAEQGDWYTDWSS